VTNDRIERLRATPPSFRWLLTCEWYQTCLASNLQTVSEGVRLRHTRSKFKAIAMTENKNTPTISSLSIPRDSVSDASATAPKFMSAVQFNDYGDPQVLQSVMAATPKPSPGKPLIHVYAASVNPIDYRLRKGEMRWLLPGGFPRIPGFDVAGVISANDQTSKFEIGERVMAFLTSPYGGGYAEYATCRERGIVRIPDSMTFSQAAAIPLAGSTALQSLRDHGKIRKGDRVLVNGASGGVGMFAVQIAKAYGAQVTGVASSRHEAFVRALGADSFIDYNATRFVDTGETWDLIFDVAGKSSYLESRRVLSAKGHFVSTEPSLSGGLMSVVSKFLPQRGRVMLASPCATDLTELCRLFEMEMLTVTIDRLLDLDDAAQAHRLIEDGSERGKIVLRIGNPTCKSIF